MNIIVLRNFLLIIIFFYYHSVIGQSEQVALDFFATNLISEGLPAAYHEPIIYLKPIVGYNGKIQPIDSDYQELAKYIIKSFYNYKYDLGNERNWFTQYFSNNDSIKIDANEVENICSLIESYCFTPASTVSTKLIIPKGIRKKNKLKCVDDIHNYKKHRLYWKNHELWPPRNKYNLIIEPAVFFNNNYYVYIRVAENTWCEWSSHHFIQISINMKVIDWCEYKSLP